MKLISFGTVLAKLMSLPTRGAWIEIVFGRLMGDSDAESLPTRGAWIENPTIKATVKALLVAPHTGSVD